RSVGPADDELLECLAAHDWPGNVRELQNLVEALFIDPPEGRVELAHLPPPFRKLLGAYQRTPVDERRRMLTVMQQTRWNKAEAAKRLHWSRMTLYRKLSQYGIGADDSH